MTRVFRMMYGVTVLAGVALIASPAAAQQTAAATASAAPAQTQTIERYTVGQARPPIVEGRPPVDLTLDDAIAIALERNLDLKVARLNPPSVDYQLQAARASFMPQFTASYSYSDSQTPSNNSLDGVSSVTTIGQGFNGAMNQTLPWYGGAFSATFSNSRSATNNITARLNPSYNTTMRFQYSMPLLAGFKIDNTRNTLRTLQVQREIVDIQLLTTIENTKNSVRTSYWALRSAIEQIEISKRALDIAQRSYDDSLIKIEIGTLAPIEATTFETQVANAEQVYLAAQINWEIAELNFKRLLVSGRDDELVRKTINPTDKPTLSVQSVDIQAAITKALVERTDIIISRRNVDVSRLNLEVTAGQTKPNLSVSSGYTLTGQGGTSRIGSIITEGGYWDALKAIGGLDQPAWNVGFNFTYPLGMRAAKANYARAVLSLDQSLAQIQAQELTVTTAVVNAGLNVENTYKLYQAAVKSREAAERNADAAQVRFDNGMLTNFEVVQSQNTLTASRLSELGRLISYVNAVAEFDRVQRVGG